MKLLYLIAKLCVWLLILASVPASMIHWFLTDY